MEYNLKKLAPIILFTYNRPWHTRQTIEALQKNTLADQSDLIIYSDAPKDKSAIDLVNQVRVHIKNIKENVENRYKGFGKVNTSSD